MAEELHNPPEPLPCRGPETSKRTCPTEASDAQSSTSPTSNSPSSGTISPSPPTITTNSISVSIVVSGSQNPTTNSLSTASSSHSPNGPAGPSSNSFIETATSSPSAPVTTPSTAPSGSTLNSVVSSGSTSADTASVSSAPAASTPLLQSSPTLSQISSVSSSSSSPNILNLPAATSTPSPPSLQPQSALATPHKSHAGTIAGTVIGVLGVLALLALAFFFRRPLLKKLGALRDRGHSRTAPSAEFMNHPVVVAQRRNSTPLLRGASPFTYAHADGTSDEDAPPPFTPGSFSDPVIEKASASAAAHQEMFDPYKEYGGSGVNADITARAAQEVEASGLGWAV